MEVSEFLIYTACFFPSLGGLLLPNRKQNLWNEMLLELMGRQFLAWVCVHCTLIFLYRLLSTWPPSSTLWTTVSVSAWTFLMWVLFLLSVAPVLRCNGITFYASWEKAEAWESLMLLFVSGIPLLFLTLLYSITQGSFPTECRACVGHLPGRSSCVFSHHQSVLSSLSER